MALFEKLQTTSSFQVVSRYRTYITLAALFVEVFLILQTPIQRVTIFMWQSWPSYLCMVCMAQSLDFTGPYSQSCKRKKNFILTSLKKLSVPAAMVVWNRTWSAIPGQQLKNRLYLYPHVEVTPDLVYHQRVEHSCIEVSQL